MNEWKIYNDMQEREVKTVFAKGKEIQTIIVTRHPGLVEWLEKQASYTYTFEIKQGVVPAPNKPTISASRTSVIYGSNDVILSSNFPPTSPPR